MTAAPAAPSPRDALAALLRPRHPLLPHIMEFNLHPGRTLHPTWGEALFAPGLWARLAAHPPGEPMLSRHLLDRMGLAEDLCLDFAPPAARFALWDGAALARLVRHAGLVLCGPALRAVIDGAVVQALRAALGEAGYAFALRQAPLLLPGTAAPADPAVIAAEVQAAGYAALGRVLAGQPDGLIKRLVLKLPHGAGLEAAPHGPADAASLRLLLRITEETEPQWCSLFTANPT